VVEKVKPYSFENLKLKSIVLAFAVTGILKGYDQLLNLVLDEVQEEVQGM
jgi:small nuclear ribonucleoprotein (snRNP)-like protein